MPGYTRGVFAATTVVAVFFRFSEERLGLLWREWMTKRIATLYIDQRLYLHMEETGAISNPDQRISEDVKSLTVTTLSFRAHDREQHRHRHFLFRRALGHQSHALRGLGPLCRRRFHAHDPAGPARSCG